jgi:hypothetical protein
MIRIIGLDDDGRSLSASIARDRTKRVRIVPEERLLQRNNRGYFRKRPGWGPTQIYVSPLDLGRRNGLIEEVHRPTLRIRRDLLADDGKPFRHFRRSMSICGAHSTAPGRQWDEARDHLRRQQAG